MAVLCVELEIFSIATASVFIETYARWLISQSRLLPCTRTLPLIASDKPYIPKTLNLVKNTTKFNPCVQPYHIES